VRVKVCGLTRPDDAQLAVKLGAWALGMVFYEASPRRCSQAAALAISEQLRRRALLCGVFVNATLPEIARHAELLALDLIQLHGDEGPAFCAEVARRTGARVIRAVQIGAAGDLDDAERYRVDFHLLDSRSRKRASLRGGTGERFDWSLLARRRSRVPLILSGGLDPENVADGIAAAGAQELYAVDTASGTEVAPGRKDPERLRAFFAAVAGAGRAG
jgi:phosphoribosylanthranilate isomerase